MRTIPWALAVAACAGACDVDPDVMRVHHERALATVSAVEVRSQPARPATVAASHALPGASVADPAPTPDPEPGPDPIATHPARYPTGTLHSPLTPSVMAGLKALRGRAALNEDAFMKIGASSTESSRYLACFAGDDVALGAHGHLADTVAHFNVPDAAGTNPFSRRSLAARSGRSAHWAVTGDPSPVEQEFEALAARYAVVHYGSNDMQRGTTYLSASWDFADKLLTLIDQLRGWGVVPIISTISRRLDIPAADWWVPTYNAIIRGVAEGRQLPLLDMRLALEDLPRHGLSSDGLHPSAYRPGGDYQTCNLSAEGLDYGYNMRNLIALDALARVHGALVAGAEAPDPPGPRQLGEGSPGDPFVIDSFPYTSLRTTSTSPWRQLDHYTGCAATQDESGPEWLYRLELTHTTGIRAMVFDQGGVDVDLHLLDETASEEGCLDRAHGVIETTLEPGTYHFAVDSWVDGAGGTKDGEYLLVIVACDLDDPDCG